MNSPALWLASRSPRRAELLRTLGVAFAVLDLEVDEAVVPGEAPAAYVSRLAQAKAAAGRATMPSPAPVLAADTTVVVDTEILGKPRDRADGMRMLGRLAGRAHTVLTGVSLALPDGAQQSVTVTTTVFMRPLKPAEIDAYWASGEPLDKAGGYAVQGLGGAFVTRLEGSYSNVVGLPLAETLGLLEAAGVRHALS